MSPEAFRRAVSEQLGPDLRRATYDNVQRLVAWYQTTGEPEPMELGRYLLGGETDRGVETAIRRFLADCYAGPAEESRQRLWMANLEMWYAILESFDQSERPDLLADLGDEPPD